MVNFVEDDSKGSNQKIFDGGLNPSLIASDLGIIILDS